MSSITLPAMSVRNYFRSQDSFAINLDGSNPQNDVRLTSVDSDTALAVGQVVDVYVECAEAKFTMAGVPPNSNAACNVDVKLALIDVNVSPAWWIGLDFTLRPPWGQTGNNAGFILNTSFRVGENGKFENPYNEDEPLILRATVPTLPDGTIASFTPHFVYLNGMGAVPIEVDHFIRGYFVINPT